MSIIGYIFFAIAAICYVGLAVLTASKPPSGSNDMGHGLMLAFLGLGFTITSLLMTIVLLVKGSFHWLGYSGGQRTTVVLLAWLFVVLTTFFCAIFKLEWPRDNNPYPQFLHWLAVAYGQLWIPLLWLVACFLSLGANGEVIPSLTLMKNAFYSSLIITSVFSGGLLFGYLRDSVEQAQAATARDGARDDEWHQKGLDEIAAHKPTDPIIGLLSYSTRVRPDDTRQAAIAKIKTHPNWEADILALLTDKRSYREVYYFLDGNAVTNPGQFAKPLNESIFWLSEHIRVDLAESNNLQDWSYEWAGIDNLLAAIDSQFLNQGVDFYPNVLRLKKTLEGPRPERFKDVRFTVTRSLDSWLDKHKP